MSETDQVVIVIFGAALFVNGLALYRHNKALRKFYEVMEKLDRCLDDVKLH